MSLTKQMKILILDDNESRLKMFKDNIEKNLKTNNVHYSKTSDEAIEFLRNNSDYNAIFLDHDLGGLQMEWEETNCGMNVVNWIINSNYSKDVQIFIHSYNFPRGFSMYISLSNAGYHVIHKPGIWKETFSIN